MDHKIIHAVSSFVQAHSGKYDKFSIARILSGQGKKATPQFGLLNTATDDEIITCIDTLIEDGIFAKEKKESGKNKNATVVVYLGSNEAATLPQTHADSLLLEQLRQWRMETADALSVPLYKVAHNRSLKLIAARMPKTKAELMMIEGIGPETMRKHANSLLAVVDTYLEKREAHKQRSYPTDTEELCIDFNFENYRKISYLQRLNDEQLLAACLDKSRIACIAGAGSGKTTVLTSRITHLVMQHNIAPRNILAVTFTKKAAQEMRERLKAQLGERSNELTIATFNSFCENILKQTSALVYSKPYSVIDDSNRKYMITKACKSADVDQDAIVDLMNAVSGTTYVDAEQVLSDFLRLVVDIYEFVKHEALSMDYLTECLATLTSNDKKLLQVIIDVINTYTALKESYGVRDYTDQLSHAVSMLLVHNNVLSALQRRYTHILVDEFQDVNVIQQQLLDLLVTQNTSLFVVGDPRQSIFGFRGSKPQFLLNIKSTFENMVVVDLVKNYRSAPNIVALANQIIAPLGYGKEQQAVLEFPATIKIMECTTPEEEAIFIAQNIKLLRLKHSIPYNQFFVLARTNAQLDLLASVFRQCDLDYVKRDEEGFQLPLAHQVVLSTVHAIKGLEAHTVFICGLVSGKFPLTNSQTTLLQNVKSHAAYEAVEEELRLFYVAVTRARQNLYLSWYRKDNKMTKNKSPFLTNDIYSYQS